MKVHGHPMSGCTQKVLATMFECHLTPHLVVVDLAKGEQKRPAHTALQPFGKVPALAKSAAPRGAAPPPTRFRRSVRRRSAAEGVSTKSHE